VALLRANGPVVLGIHPGAIRSGKARTVTVRGVNLRTGLGPADPCVMERDS